MTVTCKYLSYSSLARNLLHVQDVLLSVICIRDPDGSIHVILENY